MADGATALYRHFDKDGRLLYVGISLSVIGRLAQHRGRAHWYKRITRIEVEWFDTRAEAAHAEMIAIQDENPECNISRPLSYQEACQRRLRAFCLKHADQIKAANAHFGR